MKRCFGQQGPRSRANLGATTWPDGTPSLVPSMCIRSHVSLCHSNSNSSHRQAGNHLQSHSSQPEHCISILIMPSFFCCDSIKPYRPQGLSHEHKFVEFMDWTKSTPEAILPTGSVDLVAMAPEFAVQLVRQVNFGPLESKRYFVRTEADKFIEVSENDLIQANFQKLNSCVVSPCFDTVTRY